MQAFDMSAPEPNQPYPDKSRSLNHDHPGRTATPLWVALAFALAGTMLFNLSSFWALLFLINVDVGLSTIDAPMRGALATAVTIDLLLLAGFGLHHSVMARPRMRAVVARWIGPLMERPFYILCSAGTLMAIMALWQPIPVTLWHVTGEPARSALWVLYGFGWLVVVAALNAIDQWSFLGVREAVAALRGISIAPTPFKLPWLYRVVRHPMYLGLIIAFWATPDMTTGHALYAAGMTLYILIGVRFEERGLVASFGAAYQDYQRRVPMLLPWPR
jgi:protein-S-isoprenylcysteine O-methyltransferase Ste14